MDLLNTLKLAFRALRRNRMRSALTSLGIIIGVASVIALVGIGGGASAQIEARIASLGTNLIMVLPGSSRSGGVNSGLGGAATLKPEDAQAIAREIPFVRSVSPELRSRSQVLAEGLNWNTQIFGESADYLEMRDWRLAQGSMFAPEDVQRAAKVAVVGQTIVDVLFNGASPLGQIIRIGGAPFRVIGVLESKGYTEANQDQDDFILVPYTSHMRRLNRKTFLNTILVQITDPARSQEVQAQIGYLLAERHRIAVGGPDYRIRDQQEIAERATAVTGTLTTLLGGVAAISLIVGGIGIMNIMLVSVTERTREIGLRLAVGARTQDVLRQFLLEAVAVSVLSGLVGVVCGILGSQLLGQIKDWPIQVSPQAIFLAVGFSAMLGIFFGFYPARRAAQLEPIEALRYE
jgi:putative ABC transport system permease protein